MKRKFITFILYVASFTLFTPLALAQTPDGETPANEGVCDGLMGLTPGLYGLCVAFCEAQDAEATFDPATGEVTFAEGSKPSNLKLLEIYDRKKTDGDPPMPCVNVAQNECPCWTEPELDLIADGVTQNCLADGIFYQLFGPDAATGNFELAAIQTNPSTGAKNCFYLERNPRSVVALGLSSDQLSICEASIAAECTSRGF